MKQPTMKQLAPIALVTGIVLAAVMGELERPRRESVAPAGLTSEVANDHPMTKGADDDTTARGSRGRTQPESARNGSSALDDSSSTRQAIGRTEPADRPGVGTAARPGDGRARATQSHRGRNPALAGGGTGAELTPRFDIGDTTSGLFLASGGNEVTVAIDGEVIGPATDANLAKLEAAATKRGIVMPLETPQATAAKLQAKAEAVVVYEIISQCPGWRGGVCTTTPHTTLQCSDPLVAEWKRAPGVWEIWCMDGNTETRQLGQAPPPAVLPNDGLPR